MAAPLKKRLGRFKRQMAKIIVLAICHLLLAICAFAQEPNFIRVAIIQDASSVRLKINGFYEAIDSKSQKVIFRGKNLNTTVTAYPAGILLGNARSNTPKLLFKPTNPEAITINERTFRGAIQFIRKDNLHLAAINFIDLEDYIQGILYHEVSHYWPDEALKAQSVVSRTYAVYQRQASYARDFDVTSDIYSQVYGGKTSERYRTSAAVDATRGEVLTYKGKSFPSYYHATCAGHTEDAALLWNIDITPLKGVPCGFCKNSPHFNWHAVLTGTLVKAALTKAGYALSGDIRDIKMLGSDVSGRITKLRILSGAKETVIEAKDLRNILGPNLIRSTNFIVHVISRDVVFEGFGWGHGVGLCQWGAYFMAKEGRSYKQILEYYYPGSRVETF